MISVTDLFVKKDKEKSIRGQAVEIADGVFREDAPLDEDDVERFSKIHPALVIQEVAKKIGGVATRVDIKDESSTPIVIKQAGGRIFSIVYFKKTRSFSIYEVDEKLKLKGGKITTRDTVFGLNLFFKEITS